MFTIYKITNFKTNKSYIGYTSKAVEIRISEHFRDADNNRDNRKFYNSIRKYGQSCCWIFDIIEICISAETAKKQEIYYIEKFNTYSNGYNSTLGGDGAAGIAMSEESNKARSEKLKGKPKNYIRMQGKTHSTEAKEKISRAHAGMAKPWVKWTKEQVAKRALTQRKITKDQYDKLQELYSTGVPLKEISQKINLSYDLVRKWKSRKWEL